MPEVAYVSEVQAERVVGPLRLAYLPAGACALQHARSRGQPLWC
jgi:hypothetical protein